VDGRAPQHADALGELNTVPLYRYEEAAALFG